MILYLQTQGQSFSILMKVTWHLICSTVLYVYMLNETLNNPALPLIRRLYEQGMAGLARV